MAVSKSSPEPAQRWMSASDTHWWSISRACSLCTRRMKSVSDSAGRSRTRNGRVFMNRPTIVSTPVSSGGRPLTVTPNTTSSRPVRWDRTRAQAPWITVLTVSPFDLANRVSAALAASSSTKSIRSGAAVSAPRSGATMLGVSNPANASVQASCAASRPRAPSQLR